MLCIHQCLSWFLLSLLDLSELSSQSQVRTSSPLMEDVAECPPLFLLQSLVKLFSFASSSSQTILSYRLDLFYIIRLGYIILVFLILGSSLTLYCFHWYSTNRYLRSVELSLTREWSSIEWVKQTLCSNACLTLLPDHGLHLGLSLLG